MCRSLLAQLMRNEKVSVNCLALALSMVLSICTPMCEANSHIGLCVRAIGHATAAFDWTMRLFPKISRPPLWMHSICPSYALVETIVLLLLCSPSRTDLQPEPVLAHVMGNENIVDLGVHGKLAQFSFERIIGFEAVCVRGFWGPRTFHDEQ